MIKRWLLRRKDKRLQAEIKDLGYCPVHETKLTFRVYGIPVSGFCPDCNNDTTNKRKADAAKLKLTKHI
jgi:hypothetical protein